MISYSQTLKDADDIEQFYLDKTGMKPGYLQLSPGQASLRQQIIEMNGVTLIWAHAQGRARWQDEMTGAGLHLGFVLESEGPIYARGRAIDIDDAQIWMPGKEMELITFGSNHTLEIGIDAKLVETLGWQFEGNPIKKVDQQNIERLVMICRRATAAIQSLESKAETSMTTASTISRDDRWRDLILGALEPLLKPWLSVLESSELLPANGTSHYRLIRQADAFLEDLDSDDSFEVGRLAHSLGVPRRTIFHAYRKLLGVGPREYYELRRLHTLRSRLKRGSPSDTTVTEIAMALGFGDLGRMAGRYKRQFGESPSQTLRQV
ncbi:MAG: helix-turn-helix domain-containing protein [Pseudomonadota bacterium]|nr:helix-turn-helix domain-containing protein [Pseudomonadota bacterium]